MCEIFHRLPSKACKVGPALATAHGIITVESQIESIITTTRRCALGQVMRITVQPVNLFIVRTGCPDKMLTLFDR